MQLPSSLLKQVLSRDSRLIPISALGEVTCPITKSCAFPSGTRGRHREPNAGQVAPSYDVVKSRQQCQPIDLRELRVIKSSSRHHLVSFTTFCSHCVSGKYRFGVQRHRAKSDGHHFGNFVATFTPSSDYYKHGQIDYPTDVGSDRKARRLADRQVTYRSLGTGGVYHVGITWYADFY